jgi:hypothetical protein
MEFWVITHILWYRGDTFVSEKDTASMFGEEMSDVAKLLGCV